MYVGYTLDNINWFYTLFWIIDYQDVENLHYISEHQFRKNERKNSGFFIGIYINTLIIHNDYKIIIIYSYVIIFSSKGHIRMYLILLYIYIILYVYYTA